MNVRIFESVRWNACVHRLDLGLYSHPKVSGNGVRSHVNSKGKSPKCKHLPLKSYCSYLCVSLQYNRTVGNPLVQSAMPQRGIGRRTPLVQLPPRRNGNTPCTIYYNIVVVVVVIVVVVCWLFNVPATWERI